MLACVKLLLSALRCAGEKFMAKTCPIAGMQNTFTGHVEVRNRGLFRLMSPLFHRQVQKQNALNQ